MDKRYRIKHRDRFLRSFLMQVEESTILRRFGIGGGEWLGRRTDKGFLLYRKKRGIFSLFALTLYGSFSREGGEDFIAFRFGRCLPVVILWFSWCALMLFAGILLLGSLWSLFFLIPAVLWALPLFIYSKKEKARLLDLVKRIEG